MRALSIALMSALMIPGPLAARETSDKQSRRMKQISEVVFQNYPARALAAGEQGPVFFVVRLDDKASPTSCEVTHGSGHPRLDEETCAMIVRHAVFKSVIGPNGKPTRSVHEGVVNWRIPGREQPAFNPIRLGDAAPDAKICKRTLITGSLFRYERTCMTEREWVLSRYQMQEHWGQYQGKRGDTDCRRGGRTC
ncbi:energy transducer TonB [Sphingomonas lutea]|uniref:Energy transducer TonB n=1 Tax=Sphingomonas lutea TaxID=1045317 RepID=A0A7G9SK32_9SPHN|nr:energy transducer TonB [Sphingomonas lutea]QNN68207.1 energy transducer TonB [Sphingomonas lutea]